MSGTATDRDTAPLLVPANWRFPKTNCVIVDASYHLLTTAKKAKDDYLEKHIPTAVFFDIDECCVTPDGLDHMLPPKEQFEQYVGTELGISNDTHVIIYDNNEKFGLFSAARVWWTFRVFGHTKVSILDGGLPQWIANDKRVTADIYPVKPAFYRAIYNPALVKTYEDIQKNLTSAEFQLVDGRPAGRFNGTMAEPRPDIKPGHIPSAFNVPFISLTDSEKKTFKPSNKLRKLFSDANVDLKKPIVVSCGSALTGPYVAFAAALCGVVDVPVYDGSWTEWFLRSSDDQKIDCPKD